MCHLREMDTYTEEITLSKMSLLSSEKGFWE